MLYKRKKKSYILNNKKIQTLKWEYLNKIKSQKVSEYIRAVKIPNICSNLFSSCLFYARILPNYRYKMLLKSYLMNHKK
jgi:hypothetical protein